MAEGEEPQEAPVEAPPLSDEEVHERQAAFDQLFADCQAKDVKEKSRAERKEQELDSKSLTYAEVDMALMHKLLDAIKANIRPLHVGKGVFLDLGSGVGKACLATALLHPFQKVVGVETLQCLSDMANSAAGKYQELEVPGGGAKPELQLLKGDFVADFEAQLQELAPEVTVCLAVATHYGDRELEAMGKLARLMPEDSVFITISHGLPNEVIVDPEKEPKKRRAAAVRKALARRGVEPSAAGEIVVEPPVNDPRGFAPVYRELLQVPWGPPATVFMYKKVPQKTDADPEEGAADQVDEAE